MDLKNSDQTLTSTFNVLPLLYLEISHGLILICIRVRIHTSDTKLIRMNYLYLWLSVHVGAESLLEAVVVGKAPGSDGVQVAPVYMYSSIKFYSPPEVSSMKYCHLGVFRKEYMTK